MPATYTFDVVSTLDGFASFEYGDWGPFWGKGGPELLDHRLVSGTLEGPLDWPGSTVVSGDAVDIVARLKEDSEYRCARTAAVVEPGADGRRLSTGSS